MNGYCIPVPLGDRSYKIHIETGLATRGGAAEEIAELAGGSRVCLVTHPALAALYAEPTRASLEDRGLQVGLTLIAAGERFKTLRTVGRLYDAFLDAGLDRKSLVVAVGGGVLGDLTGFAAATFLRGIRFIQIPTTLLAQVDASVGGKTGADLPQGKNLVGAFHQPSSVLIDPQTLRTLPPRELRAGLAEIIKYGIIYDEGFYKSVRQDVDALLRRDEAALARAIARSCSIKAEVVAQDETEQGLRAILNFGHTIGHALESVTGYRRYKHGEAVAIGMVSALLIGETMGLTAASITEGVCECLAAARLPIAFPAEIDADAILDAAVRDKKTRSGRLHFVLVRRVGEAFVSGDVTREAVCAALGRQKSLA